MSTLTIALPDSTGALSRYGLAGEQPPTIPLTGYDRAIFAAAHVVADPFADQEPSRGSAIDWPRTLAFRRHLLDLGFGIAEAMDTAQRGMGLDWPNALTLIGATLRHAEPSERERIFSGVGTDHLSPADARDLDEVAAAYLEQLHAVQNLGGRVILMASRALARVARSPEDYVRVYARVLSEADKPVILHWLGEMFDPALAGYWGGGDFADTMPVALRVIEENRGKVDGIKISLLDDGKEIEMRRRLPDGVRMYTGDDFNYPALIKGDAQGYSHALLGILDPIAPVAAPAFAALAAGDVETYDRLLDPTVPLSRHIFRAPTQYYKTGVVFLAYLNGFQDHFVMIGGQQSMRPLPYFAEVFRLADRAGLLRDPEAAVARMRDFLRLYGVAA
jgi:hypothetical protein